MLFQLAPYKPPDGPQMALVSCCGLLFLALPGFVWLWLVCMSVCQPVYLVWSGLVWSGLVWSCLVWSGLGLSGLVWSGLGWAGSGVVGSGLV